MITYKATYRAKVDGKWRVMYRVFQAYDMNHAIRVLDMWDPLIIKIEKV